MQKIDHPTAVVSEPTPAAAGTPGYFTKGDPGTATPATVVTDDWLNMVQQELINVVAAGGLTPSKTVDTQVRDAIKLMIENFVGDYAVDTGAADAYVIALSPAITSYVDGLPVRWRVGAGHTNATTTPTLNAGGGAKTLVNNDGGALAAGDLPAASLVYATYVQSLDKFQINGLVPSQISITHAYDIPFNAGFTAIMSGQDLAVQVYGEMVVARAFTAVGASGYIDTVATGAVVIVDILKNGTTIWTTKPQFAISTNTMTAGVLKSDGTEIFAAGDRLTFSVTQVGSTIVGQKLRFTLKGDG